MLALGMAEDDLKITSGGIEFNCRIKDCMAFNLNLRSPSRLLMRISRFKAENFKTLEKKISAVDWNLYLPQHCSLKFHVTPVKSRLYHSDAISERCEKIILDQLNHSKKPLSHDDALMSRKTAFQAIYIRLDHDEVMVSLDCTGDLLFKRGIKQKVYKAPLRETIAFAMLKWAGFSRKDILIDPMCGSGTFSLEAAMIKANIPPGFFRSFAFETWPVFSHKTFAYLKREAEKQFSIVSEGQIFSSDIDDRAITALQHNISNHAFARAVNISKKDFFSISPSTLSPGSKGLIMLNPPYGKRLKKSNTKKFYSEIGRKLAADFKGWRLGVVLPSRACKSYLGLKLELKPIFHGGLEIFAGMGLIP